MEQISFKDLSLMSDDELKKLAKELDIKVAPSSGKDTLREAIFIENAKREARLKAKVTAALQQEAAEKLDLTNVSGSRPLPEDVAILASKRWYVKFTNMEQPQDGAEPGASVDFTKGTFRFTLYDDRIHCLPGVLLAEDIEQVPQVFEALKTFFTNAGLPLKPTPRMPGAEDMAKSVIARLSVMGTIRLDDRRDQNATSATYPVFSDATLPSGEKISRLTATKARWKFERISEAKPDSPFGLVTDTQELSHARHSHLVPLG